VSTPRDRFVTSTLVTFAVSALFLIFLISEL